MASSSRLAPFLFCCFTIPSLSTSLCYSQSIKLPFHPEDNIPPLPRQLSWPILNSLRSPADLLPTFVGAASASNSSFQWRGACFYENTAWMEFHSKSGSAFGGGTLHLKIKDAYSLRFFENNSSQLHDWCNRKDDVELPFCQIKGKYRMELPGCNTIEPYPHMNERCPSLPPKFSRPANC